MTIFGTPGSVIDPSGMPLMPRNATPERSNLVRLIERLRDGTRGGFSRENIEAYRKELELAAREGRNPRPPTTTIALYHAIQEVHPGLWPGRIMAIKKGVRTNVTKPGTRVFVFKVSCQVEAVYNAAKYPVQVSFVGLTKDGRVGFSGNPFQLAAHDLEFIDQDEELGILFNWIAPEKEYETLYDGDPVELTEETTQTMQSFFGAWTVTLPKGLQGVVDVPDFQKGYSLDDINRPQDEPPRMDIECRFEIGGRLMDDANLKVSLPREGHGFLYKIYIPLHRNTIEVHRSLIQKRKFRADLWHNLEVPTHYKQKILACVEGSINGSLEAWGLTDHLTKGKGSIMLFWGGPGSGKTMAVEALADYLERPLYIVDSSVLGSQIDEFEKGLKETIDRAKRWKAVVLWDEAEIYLRQRGEDANQNQRVAAMLRHLEAFEGVMAMTTNRPVALDFAIDSRIHLKLLFKAFDPARRQKVWDVTIPKQLPIKGLPDVMGELRQINLNGREIKTAIQNAARRAKFESLSAVPAEYILTEARDVAESSKLLRNARDRGDDWAAHETELLGDGKPVGAGAAPAGALASGTVLPVKA
jgi:hypothetical protein